MRGDGRRKSHWCAMVKVKVMNTKMCTPLYLTIKCNL
ncbi:hypothetical protein MTR67_043702 [Solanum verrucosum]|uniref:Uncharacterized protein n=1 Tax=Solanum verrucosum TaxID=315347 RepID=A0AAF0UPW5_SOLVR|nr:hypothetical protein MTR67_043684 [Solanum verrucosum]WMV50317.1 hypothetical protein MTR67_043702 [Solanum verrucosum]